MDNLKLIEDLKQEANYLRTFANDGLNLANNGLTTPASLMDQAADEIEKLRKAYDDPQWDATDAAHPAWWRGEDFGAYMAAKLIADILSGKETGKGAMNDPVATMRDSILVLKKRCKKLQERNNNQAKTIEDYRTDTKLENLRHQLNEQYIEKGKIQNERNKLKDMNKNYLGRILNLWKTKDELEAELENVKKERDELQAIYDTAGKGASRNLNMLGVEIAKLKKERNEFAKEINEHIIKNCELITIINHYRNKIDKLQTVLDRHTKYEGGVTMKCGHPIQCAYAAAEIDGGNGCSMCDLEKERDELQEKINELKKNN